MSMDKGKTGHISGKFLGDTKGNRDLATNRSYADKLGGEGEGHAAYGKSEKFLGETKGNRDLPTDRSSGVSTGSGGGQHKAGGMNAGRKDKY